MRNQYDIIKFDFETIKISFYQAFIKVIAAELYYSLWIVDNKAIIKSFKVFRRS